MLKSWQYGNLHRSIATERQSGKASDAPVTLDTGRNEPAMCEVGNAISNSSGSVHRDDAGNASCGAADDIQGAPRARAKRERRHSDFYAAQRAVPGIRQQSRALARVEIQRYPETRSSTAANSASWRTKAWTGNTAASANTRSITCRTRWQAQINPLLSARLDRRFVAEHAAVDMKPLWSIPAKMQHGRGGIDGILQVGSDRIVFQADEPHLSKSWRFTDLLTVTSGGAFQLSLETVRDDFRFQLKEPLPEERYKDLWRSVSRANSASTYCIRKRKCVAIEFQIRERPGRIR